MKLVIKNILKETSFWNELKKARDFYRYRIYRPYTPVLKEDGWASLPNKATIELTVKCNLNCMMCPQKEERRLNRPDFNFDQFKIILDNLGPSIKDLSFIGGEIFVHPDIFAILNECHRRNIKMHLSSNATLLNQERIGQLRKIKKSISGIGVSIDGLADTHNMIRGWSKAFETTSNALKELSKDFSVSVNGVLFKENLAELLPVIKLFKQEGIKNFSWQFEVFANQNELEASAKLLNVDLKDLCVEKKQDKGYAFSFGQSKDLIDRAMNINGISFTLQPRLYHKYERPYFEGRLRQAAGLRCKDIFACRVDSRGNVIFCPAIKKELGNLLEEPLEDIWNNPTFKDLRVRLAKTNLVPICKQCCRLGLK